MLRAATVYLVAAVVVTYPLAFSLTSHLGALQGPGDPYLNLWILGWGLRAWTTDPLSVVSGRVFDANIFFPAEGTLAYSDHFLLQALALAPVYGATGNAVLCYNLLLIGSIALSGLAMHALTRAVTGSGAGAYLAGLAWSCWPYRTAHLLHLQLQALYFMPLALLCLHRVMARRRWRDVIALALTTALQVAASVHYGLMTGIVLVICSVALAVATGQWRATRVWSRLGVAALLTVAFSVPVLLPYARSQQADGFGRTLAEAQRHSASVQAYTQVPAVNLLYGRTGMLAPRPSPAGQPDRTHVEHQLFPGAALLACAIWGFLQHRRSDARALAISGATLVLAGGLLSAGTEGWRLFYSTLHENVYGFQAIRAPARFAVIAMLGLSLLAALALRTVALIRHGRVVAAALITLTCVEYLNAPLPLAPAPATSTEIGRWLAREPTPGAVLHLPIGVDVENTLYMVQSLEHGRPLVNGYSPQRPAFYASLVENLSDLPSPDAFVALRETDARFVVSSTPIAGTGSPLSPLVERARFSSGTVYEVRWTPQAIAALDDLSQPIPPPAGPAPFAAGEVLDYAIYWDGGPVDLPAGTATLSVLEGQNGSPRWIFETRAATSDWVSTFFVARDRLVTMTDAAFLPLEHHREIREGRREVDRRYVYDRANRLLHTDTMSLPLGAEAARDAISALYYLRTLPLSPGQVLSVPINETGASLLLHVAVGEVEVIEQDDARVRALRVEPRIMRRLEGRRPITITLWLSDDAQRVPMRALVDAGFGRLRLELRASAR